MKQTTSAIRLLASVAFFLPATLSVAGQQRVSVYADEANYATNQTMTYAATCPSGTYMFRFNQNDERVAFDFEGRTRVTADLTRTPIGAAFLGKALQGKFYSTCPKDGLRVYFSGIEPKAGSVLKLVKYRFTIDSNGQIISDDGLDEASVEDLNWSFLHKAQQ
jgi:hypothetical protein